MPVWRGRAGSELASRASVRLELACGPRVETHCCSGTCPADSRWRGSTPSRRGSRPTRTRPVRPRARDRPRRARRLIAPAAIAAGVARGRPAPRSRGHWPGPVRCSRFLCQALQRRPCPVFPRPRPPLRRSPQRCATCARTHRPRHRAPGRCLGHGSTRRADARQRRQHEPPDRTDERAWDREKLTFLRFLLNWTVAAHPPPDAPATSQGGRGAARRRVQAAATGGSAASAQRDPRHRRRRAAGRERFRGAVRRRGLASPVQRTRTG